MKKRRGVDSEVKINITRAEHKGQEGKIGGTGKAILKFTEKGILMWIGLSCPIHAPHHLYRVR